ncbi:MAG TPA: lipase [Streptosporangiaceae bacterium]|nr:lipase [Streptosporangiaceae bacterium]
MRKTTVALMAMSLALAGGAAAAAVPATALAAPAPAGQTQTQTSHPSQKHLTLPKPTGPYQVGTVSLHLIDRSRPNPWTASPPYRELMVSVWYPARDTRRYPRAPQMLPGAAAHFGSSAGAAAQLYHVPAGTVDWAGTLTSGHTGAPAAGGGPFPVVLYSPGAGEDRTWGTTGVQDLASRGCVVVTIDAPYDSSEVEFPGGRVVDSLLTRELQQAQKNGPSAVAALAKKIVDVRVADTRFVLDDLTALVRGGHPSHVTLPAGLAGRIDLSRVGMFGVSAGGFTAAQAMAEDPRIKAGIDLDGATDSPVIPGSSHLLPVFTSGLHQPFMFMGDPQTSWRTVASWGSFWTHTPGWHLDLTLRGASGENDYKDAVSLLPQAVGAGSAQPSLAASVLAKELGSVPPGQAVSAEEAYVAAFFGRFLRGQASPLLDGPSPRYPQIAFVR